MSPREGFALPTVLIVSVILLMLLVTGMSATVAVNNGLRDQYYTKLADLAADAGNAFAAACIEQSGNQITWTDEKPLRPNTDCAGEVDTGASAYVLDNDDVRTYFSVGSSMEARGFTEAVRSSSGLAWRTWSAGSASAVQVPIGFTDPVGTYIEGAWATAPAGYLLADGSEVLRSTYSALFAVIGTSYGTGNGSTTFNLPDSRGRVLVQQSADTEFDLLGEKGGSKTHTLTVAEMPSHAHNIQRSNQAVAGGQIGADWSSFYQLATNSGTNYISTTAAGSGQAHNNLQPYMAVNRAIKY